MLKHWNGKCVRTDSGSTNPTNGDRLVFSDSCSTSNALLFKKLCFQDGVAYFNMQLQNGRCIHPDGGYAFDNVKLVVHDGCGNDDRLMFTFAAKGADSR